jgi:hypothetical protein
MALRNRFHLKKIRENSLRWIDPVLSKYCCLHYQIKNKHLQNYTTQRANRQRAAKTQQLLLLNLIFFKIKLHRYIRTLRKLKSAQN